MEGDFELVAGDGLAFRVGFAGGGFGVRAGDALVGHAQLRAVHRSRREVGDGEGPGRRRGRTGLVIRGGGGGGELLDGD